MYHDDFLLQETDTSRFSPVFVKAYDALPVRVVKGVRHYEYANCQLSPCL